MLPVAVAVAIAFLKNPPRSHSDQLHHCNLNKYHRVGTSEWYDETRSDVVLKSTLSALDLPPIIVEIPTYRQPIVSQDNSELLPLGHQEIPIMLIVCADTLHNDVAQHTAASRSPLAVIPFFSIFGLLIAQFSPKKVLMAILIHL